MIFTKLVENLNYFFLSNNARRIKCGVIKLRNTLLNVDSFYTELNLKMELSEIKIIEKLDKAAQEL